MTEKNNEGFLSRWSRRKATDKDKDLVENGGALEKKTEPESAPVQKADEQPLPVWQQNDVEPDVKKKALSALFKQPEFKDVDHMNEYDEDFTSFSGLGDIVTQEMKRMIRLAEEKTRPKPDESQGENEQLIAQKSDDEDVKPENNEEDKLA